ncbi:MFS transporter [Shimazuella sp. AN120528]|uniref:MFS transporter n=1 Tax=Shimazuella soli TaxID=1892854 RepID=UPI001F0D5658|nr:MFS transporter [Shimazuella soli]MCH5586280.1 MFS transporter [Shimazuella soli]
MDRNRSLESIRKTVGMIFLIVGQVLAISGIPDLISQSLHVRKADSAGIIMTAFGITLLVSNLVVGKLIDKVGAKRLLYWSLPLTAVILWGYPLTEDSTFALTMVRIVHGFFYALIVNTIFFVTRNSVSERHQARVTLLSGACTFLGSGLAM